MEHSRSSGTSPTNGGSEPEMKSEEGNGGEIHTGDEVVLTGRRCTHIEYCPKHYSDLMHALLERNLHEFLSGSAEEMVEKLEAGREMRDLMQAQSSPVLPCRCSDRKLLLNRTAAPSAHFTTSSITSLITWRGNTLGVTDGRTRRSHGTRRSAG